MHVELASESGITDKRAIRLALLISLAGAIGYLPFALTIPILPEYIIRELQGGPRDVGAVVGAYALASLLFRPVSGILMNRLGTKALTILGAILTMLATISYSLVGSISALAALRLLLGIGMGLMLAAISVWPVQLVAQDRHGWAVGLGSTGNYIALGVGAPLGTLINHLWGIMSSFIISGLDTLLVIPIALYVPEVRVPAKENYHASDQSSALLGIMLPCLALILSAFSFAAVSSFAVPKFTALGVSGGAAVISAYSVTVVLLRLASMRIRWEATRPIALVSLFLSVVLGIILVGVSDNLPIGVIGGVLIGIGMWQVYPILGLFVVRSVSVRQRTTALATFGACFTAGLAIGSAVLGVIAQASGYQTMFLICAACVGLGMLLALAAAHIAKIGR